MNSHPADALADRGYTVHALNSTDYLAVRGNVRLVVTVVRQKRSPTTAQLLNAASNTSAITLFHLERSSQRVQRIVAATPHAALLSDDGTFIMKDDLSPADQETSPHTSRGRTPWGKYALMRALLRTQEPRTQAQLAAETNLTQAAVSQFLAKMSDQAVRTKKGWVATQPLLTWQSFLQNYPGAGGTRTYWYSSAPFSDRVASLNGRAILSGDAAADAIAPWRSPARIVAYTDQVIDMEALGISPATSAEANIELVHAADRTVLATAKAWNDEAGIADPLLAAWDLNRTGGTDASEAVDRLERYVMERVPT
ncbi:ArsR family transcriptional regulator [Leucobacter sp. cx-169]|uniref:ArsR family transcriptional regulator n=1 Tax=Leucobacter sp. cx-169 TaxID=2770549 RepID=UPI00165DA10E|nr:ArsR family transcriptional regulator [Leucobacter sp. cx-169]MBC9927377.1 ArsR family transcriptional regulator [Leucobacter sp. cx-169]